MTEDRPPDQPQAPDPGTTPGGSGTEPASQPPPLAPLVQGGQPPADPTSDTTAQPTGSWQQAAPPPAAPPTPQPAVSWAPAPAPVAARGGATPLAMVAGILLIIGGILGGLAGLAVIAFGGAVVDMVEEMGAIPDFGGSGDPAAFITGFIVFFGAIILVYSLVYLIGGIGVLRSRDWGRVLGLIVGILSGLVWLGSVTTPDPTGVRDSTLGSLIGFGIHAYIVVVLLFFWRSRPTAA